MRERLHLIKIKINAGRSNSTGKHPELRYTLQLSRRVRWNLEQYRLFKEILVMDKIRQALKFSNFPPAKIKWSMNNRIRNNCNRNALG